MIKEFIFNNQKDTIDFSIRLAKILYKKTTVTLSGDIAAGKTFICRNIIQYLLKKDIIVTSPTFNFLNIYTAQDFKIYHYDLYRLKNDNEIFELGFEESLANGVVLIEWPERILYMLPEERLSIHLKKLSSQSRKLTIKLNKDIENSIKA